MDTRQWLYRMYARRLRRSLEPGRLPNHVALVMDGNRRWARQVGLDNPNLGHRHGAEHVDTVLGWCAGLGIRHVTVYVASSDNLRKRDGDEINHLMSMIETVVSQRLLAPSNPWRLHIAGRLEDLPDSTAHALKDAEAATRGRDAFHITIAIGYDGHQEIVDAVRDLLVDEAERGTSVDDLAERLTSDDIAAHLYTGDLPDPDLVIRTSGERRLSSFLLWQTTRSELYFCDVFWPGFRYIDFLRALREYGKRVSQTR
ncbi:MAG TPA: polyprenyl diphosphate synthase [Stackebrandtia sp.]|jgi:short-chain Z-isoprenyl diphosphate synthase|uniref:polyprenyl diphosphate synthase n=1 Tax=Stackebrandtia sp. TaxID=2023065 RepID=UPI002D6891F0|nr:polyprenyl diphosphate synthase [Stackebrandtia sp.]HZE37946.1 polyprenyl diphosphate synthase [Stackebrandtia sp.]